MKLIKKFFKDEKGSAIIETFVALPMLLGLFMGLVFFTNAMRYKLVVNMSAKEGAREYQVTMKNSQKAIEKTHKELTLGGVVGANVTVEDDGIKVVKPYGFYIPMSNKYLLNIKAHHIFTEEITERYYNKGW